MSEIDLKKLAEPFPPQDVEWRVGRAGTKGDRVWAKVLAYIESRAIMDRLDRVCGPEHWQTRYTTRDGHVTCEIGIRVGDEWVWKADGAGYLEPSGALSPQDAGKGDYSNALKRAGIEWGIGRYLYRLDEGWANVHDDGQNFGKTKDGTSFRWDPPDLPGWALPDEYGSAEEDVDEETGEVTEADVPELAEEVADLLNRAASLNAINVDAAARAEEAIEQGDEDRLRLAKDWLETQIEKKKMDGSHEPETAGAA